MSIKLCCCLCCAPSSKYKLLQNEVGESNEIYKMTVKYFDPMLLSAESQILCQDCWLHINDFHEFQLTVIKTRTVLQDNKIEPLSVIVKLEEEQVTEQSIYNELYKKEGELDHFEDVLFNGDLEDYALKVDLPEENDESAEDDDIKPLMELKKFKKSKTKLKGIEIKKLDAKDELKPNKNPKVCRVELPKASLIENTIKKCEVDETTDDPLRKTKTLKYSGKPKKNIKINTTLEKNREYDEFVSKWKPLLECDLCDESFPIFDTLRKHFKAEHSNSRCYIKCCERKFYRRSILVEHIRLHINPEMYKCDICGKSSTTKHNLKLHKQVVHEAMKKFECDVCHKSFTQKPYLDRHLLTHVSGNKDFICGECGKGFVLEILLKTHIKTIHTDKRICDQCGKKVRSIQALKKHLMEHAGTERPTYPCDECGAQLRSSRNLKRHKAAYHNDGTTVYVCSICGKIAANENALKMHKRTVHETEHKHKCSYCGKAFKRSKVLREHIATHTGQDLYECPHCPQTFKVSSNMHHHRKKVHPIEWLEARKRRLQLPTVNINQATTEVVI